ncbi:MAG: cupin domain-containing protein [Rubrivivax sp.]|jgi:uncharacterized cupin superfamily protein|nr:cupin domain-containing protein [Rubrivivax sp.]
MTPKAAELRARLVRNHETAELQPFVRGTLYESLGASFTEGWAAQQLGVSVDIVPPGKRSCPYHLHHAQEELFVVLDGEGTLRVDDESIPISRGDVMVLPAGREYPHQILNTSQAPLKYLSISTRQSPEVCEYPDSGKVNAFSRGRILIQRKADSLDYWDGEPGA